MTTPIRTLDYRPRLDPRNLAYRVTAADPTLPRRSRYWTPGVVLDQGQEGSCVGHGVVGEYLASPVRGRFIRQNRPGPYFADVGHEEAVAVYNRAKQIDEFEGVDYDGTSVRAGMLVARERGWVSGFRWALNMLELRAALEEGPVVIGVEWRDGMYEPVAGALRPVGPVVGGHCLLVTGYTPNKWKFGPHYRLRNSWGAGWGNNGSAYIAELDLEDILFGSGGEAAVPTGRAL
jgi:hypothetical protein